MSYNRMRWKGTGCEGRGGGSGREAWKGKGRGSEGMGGEGSVVGWRGDGGREGWEGGEGGDGIATDHQGAGAERQQVRMVPPESLARLRFHNPSSDAHPTSRVGRNRVGQLSPQ